MPGTRKLGKTTDQRRAMLRQQVTDFLDHGKMETTVTRCKEEDLQGDRAQLFGAQRRVHPHHPYRHPPRRRG